MKDIEEAGVTTKAEADKILQKFEKVCDKPSALLSLPF
jgi:hypothetical protein